MLVVITLLISSCSNNLNLNKVKLESTKGRLIEGKVILANEDSVVIVEKYKIFVGSKVVVTYKSVETFRVTGTVLELTRFHPGHLCA